MYSSEDLERFRSIMSIVSLLDFCHSEKCMLYSSLLGLYRNGLLLQSINDRLMFD